MLNNFEFRNPTKLIMGDGVIAKLSEEIPNSTKVMLTFGGGSVKKNGVYDQVKDALKGYDIVEFWGIEPNPAIETLRQAIELGKKENVGFLLAVGGGSVIDGTKLISAGLLYDGDAWDLVKKGFAAKTLPLGTVLTLPATGSEMNNGAVISCRETKEKYAFYSNYPVFSILDPKVTFSLPDYQIACGIADTFVHVMEQYLTKIGESRVMDRWAEGIVQTLIEIAPQIRRDKHNYQLMADFMMSATMALNGFIAMGVSQDWATHMIGHEITALTGLTHGHTATLTASTDRIKILTSVGYKDQQGLIENSNYRRVTVRNNMDIKLTDRLQFKFDVQLMNGNRLQPRAESTVFNYMNTRAANMVNQFTTGLYNGSGMQGDNPVLLAKEGGNKKTNTIRATGSFGLHWDVFDGLKLSATYTPRYITRNTHTYKNSVTTYGDPEGTTSFQSDALNSLTESANRYFYNNLQFLATYSKKIGNHEFKVMAGAERETYDEKTLSAYREGFNYPEYDVINAGNIDNMDNGGAEYEWALQSYFGRINYNFMDRYLLEANFRADGSSRFAKGNQYSYFPSVSGAWRISEEKFMEPVRHVVNNLKLRASWGMLGNQNIGSSYYPTVETLSTGTISMGGNLYPIATQTALANPDLVWETSTMTDIGFDLTLFNSLSITADWYYKTTDDILMKLDIPNIVGFSAPFQNVGKVRNVGWELGIAYQKRWNDFSLGVSANLSDVKNEITDMKGISSTSGEIRNQEGSPINSISGLVCEGFINSQEEADDINANCPQFGTTVHPGDLKYADINHDNKITADDKTIIGSTIPRYT